jgi:DNA-directed RNA polymerase specialized sigma24 family protein
MRHATVTKRQFAGYFLRRTRVPEVAADLTAGVFAAALASAARYRPEGATAAAWL